MATQYTEEFKKDAVRYWEEHKDLGISVCAKSLGVSKSAVSAGRKLYENNEGSIPTCGRGNHESDAAKENARLKKELRDTQDALDILKKAIGILGNQRKRYTLKRPIKMLIWKSRVDAGLMLVVC